MYSTVMGMYILNSVIFVYDNKDLFTDNDLRHDMILDKSNLVLVKYNYTDLQKNLKSCIIMINCFPAIVRNMCFFRDLIKQQSHVKISMLLLVNWLV